MNIFKSKPKHGSHSGYRPARPGKVGHKVIDNPSSMYQVRYNLPTTRYTMVEHWASNSLAQCLSEVREILPIEADLVAIEYVGTYEKVIKELRSDQS